MRRPICKQQTTVTQGGVPSAPPGSRRLHYGGISRELDTFRFSLLRRLPGQRGAVWCDCRFSRVSAYFSRRNWGTFAWGTSSCFLLVLTRWGALPAPPFQLGLGTILWGGLTTPPCRGFFWGKKPVRDRDAPDTLPPQGQWALRVEGPGPRVPTLPGQVPGVLPSWQPRGVRVAFCCFFVRTVCKGTCTHIPGGQSHQGVPESVSWSIFLAAAARSGARPVTGAEKVRVGMLPNPGTSKAHSFSHELDTAWALGRELCCNLLGLGEPRAAVWAEQGPTGPQVTASPRNAEVGVWTPQFLNFCSHK